MRRILIFIVFCSILHPELLAQQKDFKWRLGASGGYSNYYGDLSPHTVRGFPNWEAIHHLLYFNENYFERPSFKVSLERQLSPTIGLMLSYGQYQFAMNDRYVRKDGTIWTSAPNFSRGLNFQNNTRDLGLSFVFKTDNDRLLPSRSLIAPYFTIGFGVLDFQVRGDLLDDQGQWYDHRSNEIIHNGIFETDLHALVTEEGYDLWSFYTNLGLGFRIKLGPRIEFFAQSDLIYSFTDHLDDVSGKYRTSYDNEFQAYASRPGTNPIDPEKPYRGNPNLRNDWILYHGIGIRFNFGASKKAFKAPRLSTSPLQSSDTNRLTFPSTSSDRVAIDQKESISLEKRLERLEREQVRLNWKTDSISYHAQVLAWESEIHQRENKLRGIEDRRKTLLNISQNFQSQMDDLLANERLDSHLKDSLLREYRRSDYNLRYSLDSISRREMEFKTEIDSIGRLKSNYHVLTGQFFAADKDSLLYGYDPRGIIGQDQTRAKIEVIEEQSSVPTQERREASQMQRSATEPREERRTDAGLQREDSNTEALRRLQQENQYLRYQRDQLLLSQSSQGQGRARNNSGRDRVIVQDNRRRTDRVVVETQDQRRRRWWPFGVAGGAVVAAAILDNDQDSSPEILHDTVFVDKAIMDWKIPDSYSLDTFLADSLGRIDLDAIFIGSSVDTLAQTESNIEKAVEIPADPLILGRPGGIQLLPSKIMVFFQVNQREPDEVELKKLASLVDFVKENEGFQIVLSGFADNTGNINYNLKLADGRMQAVGKALVENYGLEPSQIRFEPGGQVIRGTQRVSNDQDRRVEARVESQE
ncbi:Outer membrane protein-associated (lipo)protein [Cecembia lonarensis LW9]|uniref:Outer membrane protein-associated (Lipo)protein n=2 Tax=Cecembia TaxID=1187078 RepID=K1KUT1_CECL9|nr:Outer membrane protein-associated (lipo)protein [Cecembia lonarensis LW9]